MNIKVFKTKTILRISVVPSLKEISSYLSECKSVLKIFYKITKVGFSNLNTEQDKENEFIRPTSFNSIPTPSGSTENCVRQLVQKFLFSCSPISVT